MEIIIQPTPEAATKVAANIIARLLREKPDAVLGLATGSTPLLLYRELVAMKLDWQGFHSRDRIDDTTALSNSMVFGCFTTLHHHRVRDRSISSFRSGQTAISGEAIFDCSFGRRGHEPFRQSRDD